MNRTPARSAAAPSSGPVAGSIAGKSVEPPGSLDPDTSAAAAELELAFPEPGLDLSQDEEWFLVGRGEDWQRVRMHDYPTLFSIPGLYEKVVYDVFECQSPRTVSALLAGAWRLAGVDPSTVRAIDLGCGNGCVGEELARLGVRDLVGLDLLPEAAAAAHRDRPGLYRDILVGDLTALKPAEERRFSALEGDLLTCVAALGFGDIPPEVFSRALDRVRPGGWVAFTIKRDFTRSDDESGFAGLLARLEREGVLDVRSRESYVHRRATSGDELHYVATVARLNRSPRTTAPS